MRPASMQRSAAGRVMDWMPVPMEVKANWLKLASGMAVVAPSVVVTTMSEPSKVILRTDLRAMLCSAEVEVSVR